MRIAILALLLLAASPAVAQTPEEIAVTECIRNLPADVVIYQGTGACMPRSGLPLDRQIFPLLHQQHAARRVVNYRLALEHCPLAKPDPRAKQLWRNVLVTFRPDLVPNEPAIRAWIDQEFQKARARPPIGTVAERCEQAKGWYGDMGSKTPNAIVMRDGSTTTRKCVLDGSCHTSYSVDVYFY